MGAADSLISREPAGSVLSAFLFDNVPNRYSLLGHPDFAQPLRLFFLVVRVMRDFHPTTRVKLAAVVCAS